MHCDSSLCYLRLESSKGLSTRPIDSASLGTSPRPLSPCKSNRLPVHGLNAILQGLCGPRLLQAITRFDLVVNEQCRDFTPACPISWMCAILTARSSCPTPHKNSSPHTPSSSA